MSRGIGWVMDCCHICGTEKRWETWGLGNEVVDYKLGYATGIEDGGRFSYCPKDPKHTTAEPYLSVLKQNKSKFEKVQRSSQSA